MKNEEILESSNSKEARAKRLRYLREELLRISRPEMVKKISGLTNPSLQNWEYAQKGGLSDRGAMLISKGCLSLGIHCPTEWLLNGTGEKPFLVSSDKSYERIPKKIPLIDWKKATSIDYIREKMQFDSKNHVLFTDAVVSDHAFALILKDSSMEPQFPKGTVLIIDPKKSHRDRSFVVAKINNHEELIFRQLIIDGPNHYLKPISPDLENFEMCLLGKEDEIRGILIQARHDYEEE